MPVHPSILADPELSSLLVVGFEPGSQLGGRAEKDGILGRRHG